MVDAVDSKSTDSDIVRVRVSLGPPILESKVILRIEVSLFIL